jgi:hypothetical protein
VVATNAEYENWKPFLFRTYELPSSPCCSSSKFSETNYDSDTSDLDEMEDENSTDPPFDSGIKGTCGADNIEALRATSAAPTYFKPLILGNQTFVDGGIVANNPGKLLDTLQLFPLALAFRSFLPFSPFSLIDSPSDSWSSLAELAVFEAKSLWPDRHIELILSVGTGGPKKTPGSENLLPMVNEIIDVATNADLIHRRLKNWVRLSNRQR